MHSYETTYVRTYILFDGPFQRDSLNEVYLEISRNFSSSGFTLAFLALKLYSLCYREQNLEEDDERER